MHKMHIDHRKVGIDTNNLDDSALNRNAIELDIGVPVSRERIYSENGIIN